MKYVGAHVSIEGGVENAPINANKIGAKAFALFVKNQKQWNAPPLTLDNINKFKENLIKYNFNPKYILPHDSYLINLGNKDNDKRKKSLDSFITELKRCEQLGLLYLNFHPGSHLNLCSEEESLNLIIESINISLKETEYIMPVIENTAGQGTNLGYKFEHIAYIIQNISDKSRIGVCLDTCHTYSAGYDIKTKKGLDETIKLFDNIINLKYLKALHLNDSKKELGSKIDRHENLEKGVLGIELFKNIMTNPLFDNIPLILETPDESLWEHEIKLLYSL